MTYSLCHILLKIIFVKYVSGEFLSSLTFVIDDTSSMSDDIDAVKKGTSQIFDTVLQNRDESQIDNFILVTFNDHSWNRRCASSERGILRAKTKEEYVFKNALAGIYVNDGGIDCAECSMAGIKRGLEESLPRSNVYVFTDASAKDYHRYEEVKKFALEKGSQIVFVLTGMCKGGTTSPSYRVYEDIARETGGEVFHIDKYSVDKVLDYVKETIKGRLYEVNTTLVSPGPNIITLNIDALMGEVFLTLSSTTTNHHSVKMTDPDGIEVYKRIVFTTDKSSSYAFNATKSGRHSVVVNTAVKARAKLAVRSAVEFGHGFSSIAVDSLMDTSSMPAPGAKTHLLIQLSKGDIALKTVKLLDISNNLIQELRLNVLDNATKLYMTEEFEPPKVTFKVEITGYDAKSDSTIVRRGSTGSTVDTISSGETMTNKPATVVIKDAPKINAKYNEQLKLTCKVEGYPKPDIVWKNEAEGITYSTETKPGKNHRYDYVNVLTIEKVTENATYTCEAKNSYSDSKQIVVEVIRPRHLNILSKTENITVEYEREGKMICVVDAYPSVEISWYRDGRDLSPGGNVELLVSHELLDKSVLTIKNSTLSDEGKYTCVARNEDTNMSIDVYYTIIGLEEPEIYKIVSNASVIKGLNTTIDCKILKGKPKPTISWYLGTTSTSPLKDWENQEQIVIADAHETDSGKYICQAKNEVGIDQHEVQLLVEVPATIKPPRQLNLALLVGNTKSTLNCQTRGIPKPEIKWIYQSFDTSLSPKEMTEHKEKERLNLENVQLSHEGYYTCVSSNSAGSSQITFNVTVLERPEIYKIVYKVSVIKGLKTTIDCIILKGKPKPTISWYLETTSISPLKVWENQEQIVIADAHETDSGKYICQAKNEVGVDKHEVQLLVKVPATIKPPRQLNLALLVGNTKSTLNCQTRGIPKPEIKWIYQSFDTSLSPKEMTEHKEKERLNLENVQLSHEGYYTCVSSNSAGSSQITFNVTVLERPEIYKIVKKASVVKGLKTTIDCIILKGKPKPTISWYLGTTSTSPLKVWENQEQIVIADAHEADSGKYICQAKNEVGVDKHEVQLLVEVPATIKPPRQLNLALLVGNKKSTLNCQTRGIPKPEIKWIYQSFDTSLPPKEMTEHKEKERLNLENVQLSLEGYYTCVSSNSAGSSQITFNVTVLERPEIYKIVKKASVIKGLKTTIDCIILKGKPKPTISWYLGTTSISPLKVWENQEQIVIADAHETDSGKYICQAKNEVGVDKHEVQLLVEVPATIKPPRQLNLTLLVGNIKSALNCQTRGIPKPEIKWFYQSFDTSLPPKEMTEHKEKERLNLENVQLSHEGYYTCVSSNSAGSSQITFNVTVLEAPLIYKPNITDIHVDLGTNQVLECKILKGKPKPSITWYFRFGRKDDDSSAHFVEKPEWNDQESIVVEKVAKEDTGTYQCRAYNSVSTVYIDTTLIVDYPPKVKTRANFLKAKEKSKVSIPCSADGSPPPDITWLKDGVQLFNDSKYTIRPESLRFDAQLTVGGNYTCIATNRLGSDFKIVRVYVSGPATIAMPNTTSFSLAVGSGVVLPCESNGYPVPTIRWTYQSFGTRTPDEKILKHFENNLHLKNIQVSEAGYYTCTAVNTGSIANLTYEVQVFAPPKIVNTYKENIFVAVEGDLVLKIDCNVTGDPIPEITWTLNDLNLALGSIYHIQNGTLFIYDVPEDASGVYKCEVENARGKDLVSYEVIVQKYPPLTRPVSQVFIREHQSQGIKCPLPHTLTDGLRWYKNQVLICKGELVISEATQRDTGNYICRVSTLEKTHNSAVEVIVGDAPEFKTVVNENINMVEGLPVTLNCETESIPEGNIKWYHGDEELNATNAIYYFPTGLKSPGVYKCNVVNRFGSISRTFRASQSYCVLESSVLMMNNKAAPLMLSSNLTWLTPEKSDQNLIISKDTQVIFFCPNKFIKFPKKYILSFCDGGANFLIDGVKYEYSHIKCAENMEHTVQRTHTNCMLGEMDTEFIKLGYNVFGDVFTPVYEVCFNKTSEIPIYTKLTIQKSLANDTYSESSWSDDEQFKMDFEEAYICEDQVKSISRSLGKWFHNRDECCFSKRQLVSPKDVFPGVPQKSTFSYFNVVPQWGTCNGQNWDEVEQRVRNYATKFENLLVWTGIAEQLSLPKLSYGKWADIFITDSRRKQQPVPLFLWKVIQNPVNMSSLAIIQVNKPDLTEDEVSTGEYTRCRDVCDNVQWMRNFYWQDVNRGYIYCCKLDEFENAFGFKGVFEPEMYDLPI